MKRIILAVILAATYGAANASGNSNSNNSDTGGNASATASVGNVSATGGQGGAGGSASATGGTHVQTNTQTTVVTPVQTNTQLQGQLQGQQQGQLQGQGQSQNANNAGNSQSVTIENNVPKQAPSGPGIASSPSATCRIAIGASIGVVGFSGGGFGSVEDENCVRNEKIRMLKEVLNRADAAKALACKDKDMADAMGDCPVKVTTTTVGNLTITTTAPVTTKPAQVSMGAHPSYSGF